MWVEKDSWDFYFFHTPLFRCKPGWQGQDCDQCVPFPGCLHGTCEKAWQCICSEGWMGSLCDRGEPYSAAFCLSASTSEDGVMHWALGATN